MSWRIPRQWVQQHYLLFCQALNVEPVPYKDFAHELADVMPRKRLEKWKDGKRLWTHRYYLVPDPADAVVDIAKRRKALVSLTYATSDEAEADRGQQLRLLAALGAWDRALRRDELAAWCITGSRGRIYTDGKGWVLYVAGRSARHWSAVRAKLAAFTTITQDGDEEGVARLHDLPAPEQAEVIREALGIRKRVAVSTEQRSRLRELVKAFGFKPKHHGEAVSGARLGGNGVA